MKDNISIIVASIIGVLMLVLFPLISVLERQDNMSYNLVMKLTTNFADEVRAKGYLDMDTYNQYINGLVTTGNTYDVQMEAHKKIKIPDEKEKEIFTEDTLIDYNKDIFEKIQNKDETELASSGKTSNIKSGIYFFDETDEFYVKVSNTNITGASIIYNYIANAGKTKVIDIKYGGVVKKEEWLNYRDDASKYSGYPRVILGLPTDINGISPIKSWPSDETMEKNYYYYFNTKNYKASSTPLTITIPVQLKEKSVDCWEGKNESDLSGIIEKYVGLEGFRATISIQDVNPDKTRFKIVLSDIIPNGNKVLASVYIKENLFYSNLANSPASDKREFYLIEDAPEIDTLTLTTDPADIGTVLTPIDGGNKITFTAKTKLKSASFGKIEQFVWDINGIETVSNGKSDGKGNIYAEQTYTFQTEENGGKKANIIEVYAKDSRGNKSKRACMAFVLKDPKGEAFIAETGIAVLESIVVEGATIESFAFSVIINKDHYASDWWAIEGRKKDDKGEPLEVKKDDNQWEPLEVKNKDGKWKPLGEQSVTNGIIIEMGTIKIDENKYTQLRFKYNVAEGHKGCLIANESKINYNVKYKFP